MNGLVCEMLSTWNSSDVKGTWIETLSLLPSTGLPYFGRWNARNNTGEAELVELIERYCIISIVKTFCYLVYLAQSWTLSIEH